MTPFIFLVMKMTLNQYLENCAKYKTIKEHEEHLADALALTLDGFVVKVRDGADFYYKVMSYQDLANGPLKIWMKIGTKRYKPAVDSLQSTEFRARLKFYDKTDLMTSDPKVLSLYRPPHQTEYKPELVKRFIKFYCEERVENPEAFMEELRAHAYRFRHPDTQIGKVFIHFSTEPDTGKSLLTKVIDQLYPNLSMIGSQSKEVKSDFSGWMTQYLNLSFEELENDEYRNKFFETFLKQTTSGKTSCRRMFKETYQGTYKCIVSMNTNSRDLYGLIRSDDATLSRLVILKFKPKPTAQYWDGALPVDPLTDEFAYSLYRYLKEELPVPDDWNPLRYWGKDRDEIVQVLKDAAGSAPKRFLKILCLTNHSGEAPYNVIQTINGAKGKMYFISNSDWRHVTMEYLKTLSQSERKVYSEKQLRDAMVAAGWSDKYRKSLSRGLGIPADEWTFPESELINGDDSE